MHKHLCKLINESVFHVIRLLVRNVSLHVLCFCLVLLICSRHYAEGKVPILQAVQINTGQDWTASLDSQLFISLNSTFANNDLAILPLSYRRQTLLQILLASIRTEWNYLVLTVHPCLLLNGMSCSAPGHWQWWDQWRDPFWTCKNQSFLMSWAVWVTLTEHYLNSFFPTFFGSKMAFSHQKKMFTKLVLLLQLSISPPKCCSLLLTFTPCFFPLLVTY